MKIAFLYHPNRCQGQPKSGFLVPWCFTHQYKNTTQFCFYAGLAATQNTNKLSTSGGVMTGNIEMTSNILSFNGDYKIYNTGGRLSIDSADGSAICFLEGNRLWLNCAGFYAFYAQVSPDGRLIFYNHDHTPVMSIAYNGGIKVKGSIEQNATF